MQEKRQIWIVTLEKSQEKKKERDWISAQHQTGSVNFDWSHISHSNQKG
jgi:hypothetical protein